MFQACFYQSATVAATVGIDEIAICHSVGGNITGQLFDLAKQVEVAVSSILCYLRDITYKIRCIFALNDI